MTTIPEETTPPFPNNLRRVREGRVMISRLQLMRQCQKLAEEEDTRFVNVGRTSLHDLEAGTRRPRLNTAATLAAALNTPVEELFPAGFDDPNRNTKGNTSDPAGWSRRGRPPKQE